MNSSSGPGPAPSASHASTSLAPPRSFRCTSASPRPAPATATAGHSPPKRDPTSQATPIASAVVITYEYRFTFQRISLPIRALKRILEQQPRREPHPNKVPPRQRPLEGWPPSSSLVRGGRPGRQHDHRRAKEPGQRETSHTRAQPAPL